MDSISAVGDIISLDFGDLDVEKGMIERAIQTPEAFVALYRMHYHSVASYLFRRTGDRHVTEDLLSEVFLIALKRLRKYQHRGVPFRFWLWGIATNLANQWARHRQRRFESMGAAKHACDPEKDIAAAAEDRDEQEMALRRLLWLKPKHQAVLTLHYLEGLSVEETAKVLNCRPGTVKSRLSRARREFRKILSNKR